MSLRSALVRMVSRRIALLAVPLGLLLPGTTNAQTFTVSNTNNAGAGSLRQAILDMNAGGNSPSFIVFTTSGTINLTSPLPDIQVSARINDAGVTGIILDGTNAGSANGLRFRENAASVSFVTLLTIRNFQQSGIFINPVNSNEGVALFVCLIENCGGDGVEIAGGNSHGIFGSIIRFNTGWGVRISNPLITNVPIISSDVVVNDIGGIQLVGSGHTLDDCFIVLNGSAESSDHRGGVVCGSLTATASGCTIGGCTLAGNTPFGVKRTNGSVAAILGNESYLNATAGIRVLGTAPTVSLGYFVVDNVNDLIITRGTATGPASASLDVEFFVAEYVGNDNEGNAYLDTADLPVALDGSGDASFFHKFSRAAFFSGVALSSPPPQNFTIDNSHRLTATATHATQGTSEFAALGAPTLPGDFDLDGDVDGRDFLIWQRGIGSPREYWEGDGDFDGDVDGDDLAIWQANYGQSL